MRLHIFSRQRERSYAILSTGSYPFLASYPTLASYPMSQPVARASDYLNVDAEAGCTVLPADGSGRPETAVRVLHLIHGEHYAGAERVQDLLAQRLPEFGFVAGLACLKPRKFPEVFQARQSPLYRVPMAGRWDLRPALRLARIIKHGGYGLVHTHTPRTAMVGAVVSALTGVPMVHHVHSPAMEDSTCQLQNRLNAAVERVSLVWAAAVIAVSHSLGRRAAALSQPGRLVVTVPNGVPCHEARPPRRPDQPEWTLGTVALFRPRKGLEVLLEALARLRAEGLAVRLRAVGAFEAPAYQQHILEVASRLGLEQAIVWTGFTSQVHAELVQMDLFVLPSLFGEGLPMVVLEALGAGVPVVASRVEGIPEAVRDGVEGLVVPPGDAAALAGAIRRVVGGQVDWYELSRAARHRQRSEFSDVAMAGGVAGVYRQVLAQPRKRP